MTSAELYTLQCKLVKGLRVPDRVVIDATGYATSPARALSRYGVRAEVALIRRDGWVIGCPRGLVAVAEALWPDEWAAVAELPRCWPPMPARN